MMLQTLVENAIKHGISKHLNGGKIIIISDFKDDYHELIVKNTGQLNGSINAEGFGIASTYDRLNLLFGEKAKFELKNLSEMVQARIIIPINI
jgi:LytS/YehU family sensor histidine kinase